MQYIKYKEHRVRGTINFPIGYYHVTQSHPQYKMPYHWHEELEFIYIKKGTFDVTINEITRSVSQGDFLIVNSGSLHGGTPHDCIYDCLVFPTSLTLNKIFSSSFMKDIDAQKIWLNEYYSAIDNFSINSYAAKLFQVMEDNSTSQELIILGLIYQIMGTIYSENLYTAMEEYRIEDHKNIYLLKEVLNHIEINFSSHISLNDLAKISGMSPKYFCRFFYEMTQHTPIDYVNYYRIERACYQLITSNESITHIALSCGFNDISYFIKTFRRYKGTSPRQYLKERIR